MATILGGGLLPEIERCILFYVDNASLLAFSQVNSFAQKTLENEGIFKERCRELYPQSFFPGFQSHYPGQCWKIISCLDPEKPTVIFKKDFLEQGCLFPSIRKNAEMEFKQTKDRLKELCGDYYQDPNSLLHQAYEELNTCKINKDYNPIEYTEKLHGKLYQEFEKLNCERMLLEERVRHFEYKIQNLEHTVLGDLLFDQYFVKHIEEIKSETESGIKTEVIKDLYCSAPCIDMSGKETLCEVFRHNFAKRMNEELKHGYPNISGIVYEILYHQCANKVVEDCWAENHWPEFFPEFTNILEKLNHYCLPSLQAGDINDNPAI